jgi:hypothetical protein
LLGGLEIDYRAHGQRPRVPDSDGVLAIAARSAFASPPDAVIITGSSRALADIDAGAMSAALGGRPVFQLGQDGVSCVPVLEQIALDTRFAGTVICGVEAVNIFGQGERARERTGMPALRIPSLTWAGLIDAHAGVTARSHFAMLGRDIRAMVKPILGLAPWPRAEPPSNPLQRVSIRHYAGIDTAAADGRWAQLFETAGGATTAPDEFRQTIEHIAGLAAMISQRGGRVLFVELPNGGRTRAVEERRYPREHYWDRFVAGVGAPTLKTSDIGSLAAFRCADGSHLDADDAPAFTRTREDAIGERLAYGSCCQRAMTLLAS